MRLDGKVAMVIGAGQSPGEGMGIGRATALRFMAEGARLAAVDRNLASAEETLAMGGAPGALALAADVTSEASLAAAIDRALAHFGRIDVLYYNVGASIALGDAPLEGLGEDAFDRVAAVNLRGAIMAAKHVLPAMRARGEGVMLFVGSISGIETTYPYVAYKASKAGLMAFAQQLAVQNAAAGIRVNCILPGLMDTAMAVDARVRATGRSRAEIVAERDARVPLRGRMGTAWDVAHAAVFLASDEGSFITGVALPVDGGALARVGF